MKRIRRHEIAKSNLLDEPLCIIPERQLEGLPGNGLGDACNFEILQQQIRPKHNASDRMKRFLAARYQQSISNIVFTPQEIERQKYKHAKRRLPNFSFSRSLNFDPWEATQFRKNFLNGKKYNLDTPLFVLKEALMKDR